MICVLSQDGIMEKKKKIQNACKLSPSATFKNIQFCSILILKASNDFSVSAVCELLCSIWLIKSIENSKYLL